MFRATVTGKVQEIQRAEGQEGVATRVYITLSERAWVNGTTETRTWQFFMTAERFAKVMSVAKVDWRIGVEFREFQHIKFAEGGKNYDYYVAPAYDIFIL